MHPSSSSLRASSTSLQRQQRRTPDNATTLQPVHVCICMQCAKRKYYLVGYACSYTWFGPTLYAGYTRTSGLRRLLGSGVGSACGTTTCSRLDGVGTALDLDDDLEALADDGWP